MAVPRLKEKYIKSIVPALREQFGYESVMQVPKVTKITLNMGEGQGTHDAKVME
jgi:large subunit ribosomal protein L5